MPFKFILSFVFALFLVQFSFAQDVQVQISEPLSLAKDKMLQGHIFSDATGHFVYYYKQALLGRTRTLYLEKYDNQLKRVVNEEYTTANRKVNMHGLKYFKNKFIWLMSERDKKKDKIRYKISKIGLDGSLTKAKTISSFNYNQYRDAPIVQWAISEDTTKAFFVSVPDNNQKSANFKANLTVIDDSVFKLWSKTVKLPYSERQVDVQSWAISNSGEVYFLAKVYEENNTKQSRRGKDGKEANYDYYLFIQRDKISKLEKKKLNLDGAYVGGAGIRVDATGNLACTGLYKNTYRGPIQGVFYLKFDGVSGDALFSDMRDFTPKELSQFGRFNTSRERRTNDVGLDNSFRFSDIQFLDDGGMIAIAEEFYSVTFQDNNMRTGVGMTRTTYYCNSIIDIRVNPQGSVETVNVVPKRMSSSTTQFAFHSVLNTGDNIYYFYNDNRRNVSDNITNPDQMRSPSSLKSYVAVVSYFDKRGTFNRKEAFQYKEVGSLLMPSYCHQIDKNRMFFFNTRPRFISNQNFQFGVITIE